MNIDVSWGSAQGTGPQYLSDTVPDRQCASVFPICYHVYLVFLTSPHYLGKFSKSVTGLPLQLESYHYGALLSLAWLHSDFLGSFN